MDDARGCFVKTFHRSSFAAGGIDIHFDELFHSLSHRHVIRGMHFQTAPHGIAKLVFCNYGEVLDVVLDIRRDSPTYGQHISLVLSAKNATAVFIPEGFAHGFLTLSDHAVVCYLQSGEYHAEADAGILWNSFGMDWAVEQPIISARDQQFMTLEAYDKQR